MHINSIYIVLLDRPVGLGWVGLDGLVLILLNNRVNHDFSKSLANIIHFTTNFYSVMIIGPSFQNHVFFGHFGLYYPFDYQRFLVYFAGKKNKMALSAETDYTLNLKFGFVIE